jgi:hypothetical protein
LGGRLEGMTVILPPRARYSSTVSLRTVIILLWLGPRVHSWERRAETSAGLGRMEVLAGYAGTYSRGNDRGMPSIRADI